MPRQKTSGVVYTALLYFIFTYTAGHAGGGTATSQHVTVVVLHSDAIDKSQSTNMQEPTEEQIELFKKKYPFLRNSNNELRKLMPQTIEKYAAQGLPSRLLEEIGEFKRSRQASAKAPLSIGVTVISWDGAFSKLRTYAQTHDVLMMPSTWCTDFIADRAVILLDRQLKTSQIVLEKHYEPASLAPCRHDGKVFGLPGAIDLRQLYVWKQIRKGGQLIPIVHDPVTQLGTTAAFQRTLETLHNTLPSRSPEMRPFAVPNDSQEWAKVHLFFNFLWAWDTDVFDEQQQQFRLTSRKVREAVDYLTDLGPYLDIVNKNTTQVESDFVNGKYAIYYGGPNTVRRLRDALGENWQNFITVISMPRGPRGYFNFIGGIY